MDNIWRKVAKKICEHEHITATQPPQLKVEPAVTTAPLSAPYTYTIALSNTVEQLDIRLLKMEQNWVQTQMGPFPKKL